MKKKGIDVIEKLATARATVAEAKNLSPEIQLLMETLIMIVELLLPRTSRNSSVPPLKTRIDREEARRGHGPLVVNLIILAKPYTLRFTIDPTVPFTNNQAERDPRMAEVQQKISDCFRSDEVARYFARIRSFISTCKKHRVSVLEALEDVLKGELPDFCKARQVTEQREDSEQKRESQMCSASP